jgi:two-component system NtrC family sensor kinase
LSFDLGDFTVPNMLRCSREVRKVATHCGNMEEAARSVVQYFYDVFVDPSDGRRSCALVRFYKTHAYGKLEPDVKQFARRQLGATPADDEMKCLTMLATIGDEPEWNDRRQSRGHQAVPLPSTEIVEQAPMIAQLVKQMGLDIADVVEPSVAVVSRNLEKRSYGVFHVENAIDSPYIPAQEDFVKRYVIRSVVGFGGLLRTGDLFAVILFSRTRIGADSAERFRNVALDVKYALFGFTEDKVFSASGAESRV